MAISLRSVKTFLGPGAPWKEPSRVFVESNQARTTQSEVRGVEEGIESELQRWYVKKMMLA